MTEVLKVTGLTTGYGPQPVIRGIDLTVSAGEVVALLGANGAGKTTTLLAVSGVLPVHSGTVEINGVATKAPLHKRARSGMSFVTEERSVFKGLSSLDNMRVGGVDPDAVLKLFPELEKRLNVRGGLLSGGEQQMLTLGRALCRQPKLLLADELSLGLAPLVVARLLQAVRSAADDLGAGVLLVEQHARKALHYVDRVYVMRRGQVHMSLAAEDARRRIDQIEAAYLPASASETHDGNADGRTETSHVP